LKGANAPWGFKRARRAGGYAARVTDRRTAVELVEIEAIAALD
jgi:hypothetical protein